MPLLRIEGEQANPQTLRYRVVNSNETPLVQSDVTSLKLFVYDVDTGLATSPTGGVDLTVSVCVFNTLQSWDVDSKGYNFKVGVVGSYFPLGAKTYRVEVKATPSVGQPFYLEFVEVKTLQTFSAS